MVCVLTKSKLKTPQIQTNFQISIVGHVYNKTNESNYRCLYIKSEGKLHKCKLPKVINPVPVGVPFSLLVRYVPVPVNISVPFRVYRYVHFTLKNTHSVPKNLSGSSKTIKNLLLFFLSHKQNIPIKSQYVTIKDIKIMK